MNELPEDKVNIVLYGTGGEKVKIHYQSRDGRQASFETAFEGIIPNLKRRYDETSSEYIREKIESYMTHRPCDTCHGQRLRPEAAAVTVTGQNIIAVAQWPVLHTLEWAKGLKKGGADNGRQAAASPGEVPALAPAAAAARPR